MLLEFKSKINKHGLQLEAIENFNPAFWHDILLHGTKKEEQMEKVKEQISIIGKAGIQGYLFSGIIFRWLV
jgi:mannonate dehydratase